MRHSLFTLALSVAVLACQPRASVGQPAARSGAEAQPETIRIRRLDGLGRRARVTTPVYTSSIARTATRPAEWLELRVTYDTAPEWIDELIIEYFVLMTHVVERRNVYSLFRKTVRYMDVEQGRGRQGTAYLLPSALKRFGNVAAVAVEMSHDGRVAAAEFENDVQLPERWWRNPLVLESQDLTVREGYLLNRAESPWAYVNIDDYEVIK